MKIFIEIPKQPNDQYKVSAIKAIRNLSSPPLSLKETKDMVETPGWHHIPNNVVEPLGKTKCDLISFMGLQRIDYDSNSDAIYDYGGHVVFLLNNTLTPEQLDAHEAYKNAYRRLMKASEMYTIVGRALDRAWEIAVGEDKSVERNDFWSDKIDAAQLILTERLYEQEEECRRALHDAETALFKAYEADTLDITLAADGTVRYEDERVENVTSLINALRHEVVMQMANE